MNTQRKPAATPNSLFDIGYYVIMGIAIAGGVIDILGWIPGIIVLAIGTISWKLFAKERLVSSSRGGPLQWQHAVILVILIPMGAAIALFLCDENLRCHYLGEYLSCTPTEITMIDGE